MQVTIQHVTFKEKCLYSKLKDNVCTLPRIGEKIAIFHEPWPTVTEIIWDDETFQDVTIFVN
jgi:hypothetical protein